MMIKTIHPINKQTKPVIGDKQRGVGAVELLNAVAILGAAVVVAAMRYPKLPAGFGA
jgi:hypothetical protein